MGFINLADLKELTLAPGISARVISAETFTVAHVTIAKDATLPEHQHHHEQVVNVIEGEMELTVEGKTYILAPGQSFLLPPNMPHSGKALSDCRIIDVFHPVREDFRDAQTISYGKK